MVYKFLKKLLNKKFLIKIQKILNIINNIKKKFRKYEINMIFKFQVKQNLKIFLTCMIKILMKKIRTKLVKNYWHYNKWLIKLIKIKLIMKIQVQKIKIQILLIIQIIMIKMMK